MPFMLLFVPMMGLSQSHPILRSFSAIKQSNGILLRWVIRGGNQCNGTIIYRSADDVHFGQIGFIDGVCGSTDSDESYSFFDSVPLLNADNHYRLELGAQGFTETLTVFYEDFGANDHLVMTDRATGTFRFVFSNDQRNTATLTVFDLGGNAVFQLSGNGNQLVVGTAAWRSGIYLYRIEGVTQKDLTGKFYIH